MSTLRITVENEANVKALLQMFKKLDFEVKVEKEEERPKDSHPVGKVKKAKELIDFLKAKPEGIANDIEDPVEWQRKLRDENYSTKE